MNRPLTPPGERIASEENAIYPELVANAAHQIVNPLTAVVGTIDNIIDKTISGARLNQRTKMVREQLSYAIELVRNMAYLSLLTSEQGRVSLRNTVKTALLPEVIIEAAMFFHEMSRTHFQMDIQLVDKSVPYRVRGDRDLLRQVFTNLFDNAIKYGHYGTPINVRMHVQKHTGQLLVDVENTGVGFSYDEREGIFERGKRGEAATRIKSSGSGLGLYICREILDAGFGATIEAEHSNTKELTTFRIRFPHFTIDTEEPNI